MSYKHKTLYSLCFIFILTSCSTVSEPAYEIVYEPISDQVYEDSFESLESSCNAVAQLAAEAASVRAWERKQAVLSYRYLDMFDLGSRSALAERAKNDSEAGRLFEITLRRASMQAQQTFLNTWAESRRNCMMENGFQELRVCTSNCSDSSAIESG